MQKYSYKGPVLSGFGALLTDQWVGETWATSENKARTNLAYQFKSKNNMLPTAKVSLSGKIIEG